MRKRNAFLIGLLSWCALAAFAESGPAELFAEAESFYHAGNHSLAHDAYASFVLRFPASELVPDAQYRRALCLYRLGRWDESLDLLEKILKRHRATRYLNFIPFWKGMVFFQKKEFEKAVPGFNEFLSKGGDPSLNPQALYFRAAGEASLGRYEEARETARRLLVEYPRAELADHGFVLLAFIHFKRNDPDEVIRLYQETRAAALPALLKDKLLLYYAHALSSKDRSEEAGTIYKNLLKAAPEIQAVALAKLFALAQKHKELKELEALVRQAETALAGNPAVLVDFWSNIGIASFQANQLPAAEYYFTRAWNMRDKVYVDETVPLYLAEILSRRGDDKGALAVLEEYLAGRERRSEGVLLRLGSLAAAAGDFRKAGNYLTDFLRLYPASSRVPEAQYLYAHACSQTGEYDRGLELSVAAESWPADRALKSPFLRLRARLFMKKGDLGRAAETLRSLLSVQPRDAEARRDLAAVLFTQKKFKEVVECVKGLAAGSPGLKKDNPALFLSHKYYEGLAYLSLKEYGRALESLAEFTAEHIEKRGVKELYPSVVFYRGWAFYRSGKTNEAAPLFRSFVVQYPGHELYGRALYLAGWCLYSGGNYAEAAVYFRALSEQARDKETAVKGAFFLGKSLLAQRQTGEALKTFSSIFEMSPASPFAPDALYEYARLLAEQGRAEAAAAAYARLAGAYPKHALAEEALYARAELFYRSNALAAALEAFALHREKFPAGSQVDASYYWSGLCALGTGDRAGALGHWEKLIQSFRESSFRSAALKKAAETYRRTGANDKALAAWRELAAQYPKEAAAAGANDQIRELQYLVMGYGGQEALLTARAEKEGGRNTHPGRLALVELAAFHLDDKEQRKLELAHSLILQVLEKKDDRETQARAQYLLGEYYQRKKDFTRAGNEYLKAALIDPGNRDLAARAIYQSALMLKQAGDVKSTRELVERLVKNFPESRWSADGKKLLEGLP